MCHFKSHNFNEWSGNRIRYKPKHHLHLRENASDFAKKIKRLVHQKQIVKALEQK